MVDETTYFYSLRAFDSGYLFMRGLDALSEPGFSLQDIYIQNLVQDIRIPGQRQAHGMAEGGMDPAG